MANPYCYELPRDRDALLAQRIFPEQLKVESEIIHDWLVAHVDEYDRIEFSVRLGEGQTPDPNHLEGIQRMTELVTRSRADAIASRGGHVTIVEAKERATPSVLGQLLTYRRLFLDEHPEADEPRLLVIARRGSPGTVRVLNAEGVDVLIYEAAATNGGDAASGV